MEKETLIIRLPRFINDNLHKKRRPNFMEQSSPFKCYFHSLTVTPSWVLEDDIAMSEQEEVGSI